MKCRQQTPLLPEVRDGPPTGPGGGGKLCSGAWKHGAERPVGVISLCKFCQWPCPHLHTVCRCYDPHCVNDRGPAAVHNDTIHKLVQRHRPRKVWPGDGTTTDSELGIAPSFGRHNATIVWNTETTNTPISSDYSPITQAVIHVQSYLWNKNRLICQNIR